MGTIRAIRRALPCLSESFALMAVFALVAAGASCAGLRRGRALPPPPLDAQLALESAFATLRAADPLDSDAAEDTARAELRAAISAAPDWIAPQRLLDDLRRGDLEGPDVWAERAAQQRAAKLDARALYLLGRLEGAAGTRRFEMAIASDPSNPWPQHAMSVEHELKARPGYAHAASKRAFERARGAYEHVFFGRRLASQQRLNGDREAALATLREAAVEVAAAPALERSATWIDVHLELARVELDSGGHDGASEVSIAEDDLERGTKRALGLIAEAPLTRAEVAELAASIPSAPPGRAAASIQFELQTALESRRRAGGATPVGIERLDATELRERLSEFAEEEQQPTFESVTLRRDAFDAGDWRAAVQAWHARIPAQALARDGAPLDARLARLVELAPLLPDDVDQREADTLLEFANALVDAGWSSEARSLLLALDTDAGAPPEVATTLTRAAALEALLGELDVVLESLYSGAVSYALTPLERTPLDGEVSQLSAAPARGSYPLDLDAVLAALAGLFERFADALDFDAGQVAAIHDSPRQSYGPLAEILVPSPSFSTRDGELELGVAGEPVPGLTAILHSIGRVGLFGKAVGRGVDGTVLRSIGSVERSGELLGTPWSGTVLYCEGADADGSISRGSGRVSGAALHEGYWIDIEAERRRLVRFEYLERRYLADSEALARALDERGPVIEAGSGGDEFLRIERRRIVPLFEGGDRVRLAVLEQRHAEGRGSLTLSELMEVVETHEQGHLTDHTRFLPLEQHLGRATRYAASHAFRPDLIERNFEYRAQLIALAEVSEPRLALAEMLDSAAVDERTRGLHAKAYTQLLEDVLRELDRRLAKNPSDFPELDPERYLVYQLHALEPERLRELAVAVARDEGLVADGR